MPTIFESPNYWTNCCNTLTKRLYSELILNIQVVRLTSLKTTLRVPSRVDKVGCGEGVLNESRSSSKGCLNGDED